MEPSRPAATPLKAGAGTTVAGGGEPPYDGNMEHRITSLEAVIPTLATKADLVALGAELRAEIREGLHQNATTGSALRTEIQDSSGELRTEMQKGFGELRAEMQKISADNRTWMLATVLTIVGTSLAAIIGISQVQKATPPAPIIITIPAAK